MKKLIVKLIKLDNALLFKTLPTIQKFCNKSALLSEVLTVSLGIYTMLYEKTIDLLDKN